MSAHTEDLVWRKPFFGLVLLLSVPVLYLASVQLFAGVFAAQSEMFLQDWERKQAAPVERAVEIASTAAERSVTLLPVANGEYLDRVGRIHEWRDVFLPFGAIEAESSRREALNAYRASTEVRPLWPHTWVQLAYIKLRLLEFDDEFDKALLEADRLGPWRISVQSQLAEVGMIAWPQLNMEQRLSAWRSLQKTLIYDAQRARPLLQLAKDAGLYSQMCITLDQRVLAERKVCAP